MWYVASPDMHMATYEEGNIKGFHESVNKEFYLSFEEDKSNRYATYTDGRNNTYSYSADYFFALTIDEQDTYDAKKYLFNELHNNIGTTPPHLFDPKSLYRA
jgi:hypothetical protein